MFDRRVALHLRELVRRARLISRRMGRPVGVGLPPHLSSATAPATGFTREPGRDGGMR